MTFPIFGTTIKKFKVFDENLFNVQFSYEMCSYEICLQQVDVLGKLVEDLMNKTQELLQPNPGSNIASDVFWKLLQNRQKGNFAVNFYFSVYCG